jgi:hypothetical protein
MSATDLLGGHGPADEIAIARLRRVLATHFGHVPYLDAHLALLDRRGVTYASHIAADWQGPSADMLFGVVRHVVRTQCVGPTPQPDIEGWLAAGRPDQADLGSAWDLLHLCRYGHDQPHPQPRPAAADEPITALDAVIRSWPGPLGTFATAYARVERFIEQHGVQLPPINA